MARTRSTTPAAYQARARRDFRTAKRCLAEARQAKAAMLRWPAEDSFRVRFETLMVFVRSFRSSAKFARGQAAYARRRAAMDARYATCPF